MEIHNNNISRVSKENISIQKKSTPKPVESKQVEANSLNALASYGRAQVNSCSFKGTPNPSPINVSQESRLNLINLLGITDKDEIKRLLNLNGFQFVISSAFLYLGLDIDAIEENLGGKIEDFQDKNLVPYIDKSKSLLIDNPQEVINFVNYMHEKNVSFDDELFIASILITKNEDSLSVAKKLLNEPDDKFSKQDKLNFLDRLTSENTSLAEELIEDKNPKFNSEQIINILQGSNKDTIEFVREVLKDDTLNYNAEDLSKIIQVFNKDNLQVARELLYNPKSGYSADDITRIINNTTELNSSFAMDLICDTSENRFAGKDICNILGQIQNQEKTLDFVQNFIKQNNDYSNEDKVKITTNFFINDSTIDTVKRLTNFNSEKRVSADTISSLLSHLNYDDLKINFANYLIDFYEKDEINLDDYVKVIPIATKQNIDIMKKLIDLNSKKSVSADTVTSLISTLPKLKYDDFKTNFADYLIDIYEKDEIDLDEHIKLIPIADEDNIDLIKQLINLPEEKRVSVDIMLGITSNILNDTNNSNEFPKTNKTKLQFAKYLVDMYKNNKIDLKEYVDVIPLVNEKNIETAKIIIDNQQNNLYSFENIKELLSAVDTLFGQDWTDIDKLSFSKSIIKNSIGYNVSDLCSFLRYTTEEQAVFIKSVLEDDSDTFSDDDKKIIIKECQSCKYKGNEISDLNNIVELVKQKKLTKEALFTIIDKENDISLKDIMQLKSIMDEKELNSLSKEDLIVASHFKDIYKIQDINEIPIYMKRNVLKQLISKNQGLFDVNEDLRKYFPLLPKNQEEYCTLIPNLIKSLGIETVELSPKDISDVKKDISSLSNSLKSMSDEDFKALEIEQEYSSAEFIKDTYNILKDIPKEECQKVYDYFGFELHCNKYGAQVDEEEGHKYSITGYPVNLNNGKKLAAIKNPLTKSKVEQLRPYVIKYSQENQVRSNNKEIETLLNDILSKFPELRTEINKKQHGNEITEINNGQEGNKNTDTKNEKIHGAHDYDLMKHSLKVMQKIVQNPEFDNLKSESDKNIMLLASLFHDITKPEGHSDKHHPEESAVDSYYILKKMKLSKEEEIKLYTLIKNHEWLQFVNTGGEGEEKRQQSVAFDMRYDNLFDMAKIFTIADLKAVTKDESFYSSYKKAFLDHSKAIETYIQELRKSQPLLPVTRIPKASTIRQAIQVNNNGSTNIKGVYEKDGLIIIKYNEVKNEDWVKLGFPEGSISKGIESETPSGQHVDTGNIKFFVHGLEYADQLAKFDAFTLPDSDALLSVSYTERPESKFQFYKPQGVILTTPTKYTHGGGETAAGSGFGKNIDDFKRRYIFGGERESDRKFISDMIKKVLNMSDDEYIEFVQEYSDKPFTSILDPENKIIKAFANINSQSCEEERKYNEMYISNPEVMGVFAYPQTNAVGKVIPFVEGQPEFLKEYARSHDLPFIVFGY